MCKRCNSFRLHPEKTRIVSASREHFTFLGYTHFWRGKIYLDIGKKARQRIRDELRRKTRERNRSLEQVVRDLNPYIRGARQYFQRAVKRRLSSLDHYVLGLIARWWKRKLTLKQPAWSRVLGGVLHVKHGLEPWYSHPSLRTALSRRAT
ncbi:MAG: group II intron maturase-specific domain-containing protein [Myxococcales bacterium]